MLVTASLVLLAVPVLRVALWSRHRVDVLGRTQPFPAVSVSIALLGAIGCAVPPLLHARLERTLSLASTRIVGFPVRIDCQSLGKSMVDATGDLGHVRFGPDDVPERMALVKREQCQYLRSYLRGGQARPDREQVIAVHVLTHEAMHMKGIRVEAIAECAAMQQDSAMARELGASEAQARALAATYWRAVYPAMPDDYRSPDCRPGGALDERIPDAPWLNESRSAADAWADRSL